MSEFNPGAPIERGSPLWPADQDRPDWLRDDARVMMRGSVTGWWYGDPDCTNVTFVGEEVTGADAIRLDASDIVYQCIAWNEAHPGAAPMWPWYGGDEAPSDLGNYVMFKSGAILRAAAWSWEHKFGAADIIGYQRRPATSHPEPEEEWEGELTAEEQAMVDAAWEKHKAAGPCDRPPSGWKCTRGYGHSGPCAAVRRPAASIGKKHGWKCNNCQTVFTSEQDERREGDDNGGPTCPGCKAHGQYTYPYRLHHGDPAEEGTATTLLDDAKSGFNERQARRYAELAGGVFMPWMTASEADDWVARYVPANYPEIGFGVLDTLGIVRPDPTPLEIARAEYPDADPAMIERIVQIAGGK